MSTTTTTDTTRYALHSYLADYELHHSDHPSAAAPGPNPHPDPRSLGSSATATATPPAVAENVQLNPPQWPSNHRRIPPYRPINKELDQSQRRVYTSTGERVFLFVMFSGLQVNVDINHLWNATGGRIASVFQYRIGGEW